MDMGAELSTRSDAMVPARPELGLLAGTQVRTQHGVLPVEYLEPGDRIVTRAGARRLLGVSVQQRRMAAVVRVRATTLGHDRPEQDLLLAPGQPVMIRDWRARALYGVDAAAIPAARLADGEFIVTEVLRQVRLFTLLFAEDEVIYAEGLEIACPAAEADVTVTAR
jgi:Hint domain